MKKLIAILALLALTCTAAFAATHDEHDIAFTYDDAAFEITTDDHTDDEDLIILTGKNEAWGNAFVSIHLGELEEGETFPTLEEISATITDVEITQGEWAAYKDVLMYTVDYGDSTENYFIAPIYDDDDAEVEEILTVKIGIDKIEDEDAAMARDDAISEIVDTLKVED